MSPSAVHTNNLESAFMAKKTIIVYPLEILEVGSPGQADSILGGRRPQPIGSVFRLATQGCNPTAP